MTVPLPAEGDTDWYDWVVQVDGQARGAAPAGHTHSIAATTGLQSALDGKAASSHGHAIADVSGLQAALDAKAAAITPNAATSTGGTTSVDAAASFGPSRALSLTGNITVNGLTNVSDQRRLLVEFYASGATRTVGIASPVVNGSDATLPLSIPSGKSALVGFYYSTRLGYPVVVSAKVLP